MLSPRRRCDVSRRPVQRLLTLLSIVNRSSRQRRLLRQSRAPRHCIHYTGTVTDPIRLPDVNTGTRTPPRRVRWAARLAIGLALATACIACDSMELTIAVREVDESSLEVVNANDTVWTDARLVVEAFESEGATRTCAEEVRSRWQPGESIRVPRCTEKVRLTLTADGETARFSYANGQLYRRIGRKEVPIAR